METITMSQTEISRLEVMQTDEKRMSQAGRILSLGVRQIKRLLKAYRKQGATGLVSKRRGQPRGSEEAGSGLVEKQVYPPRTIGVVVHPNDSTTNSSVDAIAYWDALPVWRNPYTDKYEFLRSASNFLAIIVFLAFLFYALFSFYLQKAGLWSQ